MGDETKPNVPGDGTKGDATPSGGGAEAFTEEQWTLVNRAIAMRFEKFEKKQDKALDTFASSLTSSIDSKFGDMTKALEALKPAGDSKDSKGGKAGDKPTATLEETPEFKAMLQKQEELDKKLKASETREKAARDKARGQNLETKTMEVLQKQGLDATRARIALGHLVKATGSVRYESDDSDEIVFGEDGEELSKGVTSFLKSDEGKVLLPPKGTRGSGDGSAGNPRGGAGQQAGGADWGSIGARILGGGG